MGREAGASLIEIAVAVAICLLVAAAVFAIVQPARGTLVRDPERADMQQRLRVLVDRLQKDLFAAGAGAYEGAATGPLTDWLPAVLPYRAGTLNADAAGSFKPDTITVLSVARGASVVSTATYALKTDATTNTSRVTYYDGGVGPDAPLVDNVVALAFEYYGDPQPPRMRQPLASESGPWTTYGPKPSTVAAAPWAAGENCAFFNDGSPTPQPKLPAVGPGTTLVPLAAGQLTDGPWCPDGGSPVRWDADLLRVRRIAVTVRVQAAPALLRGPAGALFARAGTSRGGHAWLPDLEVHFDVSPPNLNRSR